MLSTGWRDSADRLISDEQKNQEGIMNAGLPLDEQLQSLYYQVDTYSDMEQENMDMNWFWKV